MNELFNILAGTIALAIGLVSGYAIFKPKKAESIESYRRRGEESVKNSIAEAQNIKVQNIKRIQEIQEHMREQEGKNKTQLEKLEKLIVLKEEQLLLRNAKLKEIQSFIENENEETRAARDGIKILEKQFQEKLLSKTGRKMEDIKAEAMSELQRDLELEREDRLYKYEEYLKEDRERQAKNLITSVIQRYSAPTSVEKRSSTITVPRDEAKGKIIGKNAENILLIEELSGVDVIFNDAPNTIIVSCFDLVKRHVARETITKLLKERIVTPEKIRQKITESQNETEKTLVRIGKETVKMLGLDNRNLPDDFMKIMGRLKFRTSYGQNILKHSFEVGYFTLMLGSELGLNLLSCKIGGFFHDIGKAIDQEVEGSHDMLTREIMEKFDFSEEEIHAAWAHHDAIAQRTPEAMLVKAGDAISAGRPGARQESLEKYIERIQAIEKIASSYEGVSKTFAISAGREVRVIVEPQQLEDNDLMPLAEGIAEDIQANVAYPGKIKVNVIRRTKNVDYAK